MSHPGKIPRLPVAIRNELNGRLARAESSATLLPWVNALPCVRELLAREFGGRPITKHNLCKWRAHGFAVWQFRREMFAQAQADGVAPPATDGAEPPAWTEHLARLLAMHYAAVLAGWNGDATGPFRGRFRAVRVMCREIDQLRRAELGRQRRGLEEGWRIEVEGGKPGSQNIQHSTFN